ncbi:transcriptional regulator [Labilibaculum filiforme]|uniref:Transcriptional regulator n=1 Tax=Labilibaculum filiforme TaxID=1940526 RepID=A0A2N3I2C7_9BACT|nr:helix-turn-helix transcriptional regulator [Labilibaculum filiforme]PKQ64468.1 transcriptional regulator [Labilibaculum filiforme]
MGNANNYWVLMSDKAIISTIGRYVKQQRLLQNKTQAKTAEVAGVNRWTISQLEKGEAVSLLSLLQILRALDLLHVLDNFKIETQISPLELAKLEKKKRQRARSKDDNEQNESEW